MRYPLIQVMNMLFPAIGSEENRQALIGLLVSAVLVVAVSFGARILFKGHFIVNAEGQESPMIVEGVVR